MLGQYQNLQDKYLLFIPGRFAQWGIYIIKIKAAILNFS